MIAIIIIAITIIFGYAAWKEHKVMKRVSDEYNEIDKRLKSVSR